MQKIKILHIEDNPLDAELVHNHLKRAQIDFEATRVENRNEFIEALYKDNWDLIFADRSTPTFDGVDALSIAHDIKPKVPFIFVSGTLDEELAIQSLKNGATDYVLKHRLSRLVPAVERAIHERNQRLEIEAAEKILSIQAELLDRANDAIVIRDLNNQIQYWNQGAENLFGYNKQEALGKDIQSLLEPEARIAVDEISKVFLKEGRWEGEIIYHHKDGRPLTVSSGWTLQKDEDGRPIASLEIDTDITQKKLLEQQLFQSQKLESLGTLAGGVAHDFNNILTIIIGYTSLLQNSETPPKDWVETVATIGQAAERGAGLVRQLLTFARRNDSVLRPVNLNALVADLAKMLEMTFPKSIEIRTETSDIAGSLIADINQVHQALLNLCVNARDAMPDGGTLILRTQEVLGAFWISRYPEATEERYILIEIADTGTGMDSATASRIFEPFFTTKEVGKGTGLGLAVVYGVMKDHRGFVAVESKIGQGTVFRLFFPVSGTTQKQDPFLPLSASATGGQGETILIVEDEEVLLSLLKSLLEAKGYKTMVAVDGQEGFEIFKTRAPEIDLIISDMGLPKLSGLQMFKKIKEITPDVRMILCSGFLEPSIKSELLKSGIKSVLHKPFQPQEVLQKIREILDVKAK